MPFSSIWSWLTRGSRGRLDHLQVVFYTRRGCHLCETAWEHLRHAQRQFHFGLSAVDVDTDPELARLHGEQVPVVTVNGRVRFRGGVNRALLMRLLRAEAKRGDTGASTPTL
jgi:glutaredoxin